MKFISNNRTILKPLLHAMLEGMTRALQRSASILTSLFSGFTFEFSVIIFEFTMDVSIQRIFSFGIRKSIDEMLHHYTRQVNEFKTRGNHTFVDGDTRAPLIFKNGHTNLSFTGDIRMINFGFVLNCWWFEWVILREFTIKKKESTGVRRPSLETNTV
jgi:hypothetical protein